MKLNIEENFTLEVFENEKETVLKGVLRPFTKKEKKDFKRDFEANKKSAKELKNKTKELFRVEKKIKYLEKNEEFEKLDDLYSKFDKLEETIEAMRDELLEKDTEESVMKQYIETRVSGDIDEIKSLCEKVGYSKVYLAIQKDIDVKMGNEENG